MTRTAVTINGETYVKVQSNQSTSTPGVYPIGAALTVQAGQRCTFKVKGYASSANVHLYVGSNGPGNVWPGALLPVNPENEDWVSNDFTVPTGTTEIYVGVLWGGPTVGATFHLNKVGLYRHNDDDFPAGFELANQTAESGDFLNYHTNKISSAATYAHSGSYSYKLSASTSISNDVIGPAQSLRVYPGDMVRMEVWGKYLGTSGSGTGVGSVIASALQEAFELTAGGGTDAAYQAIGSLFSGGALIGTTAFPYEDETPPKAFLNYILFDENYMPYDFGYDQIGTAGAIPPGAGDKMSLMARVTKPGYLYIYVSNENPEIQEVYFDDLAIKHVKTPVIQGADYYAFGLQNSNSWMKENNTGNQFLYNAGSELNSTNGWYETHFRGYDPALGRFHQVDPMSSKFTSITPYNYGFNDPIYWNDPSGADATLDDWVAQVQRQWEIYDRYGFDAWVNFSSYGNSYGVSTAAYQGSTGGGMGGFSGFAGVAGPVTADLISSVIQTLLEIGGGSANRSGIFDKHGRSISSFTLSYYYIDYSTSSPDGSVLPAFVYTEKLITINTKGGGESSWLSDTWGWIKDHFEVSGSYEYSVGWQLGGGIKKGAYALVDFGSSVRADAEFSLKKGPSGGMYKPSEKTNAGLGAAYYGGFEFQQQTYKGQIANKLSVGAFGFIGGEITLNNKGEVQDWFWGIDFSAKGAVLFGIEVNFKLGFSK